MDARHLQKSWNSEGDLLVGAALSTVAFTVTPGKSAETANVDLEQMGICVALCGRVNRRSPSALNASRGLHAEGLKVVLFGSVLGPGQVTDPNVSHTGFVDTHSDNLVYLSVEHGFGLDTRSAVTEALTISASVTDTTSSTYVVPSLRLQCVFYDLLRRIIQRRDQSHRRAAPAGRTCTATVIIEATCKTNFNDTLSTPKAYEFPTFRPYTGSIKHAGLTKCPSCYERVLKDL
ncbi:uncharacterized protein BT62DRAFT_1080255 [Guyanagaster necrorhizus]|uniref:Uncharacterized protein n=1 Tax=Guyanagaster necrorhizus TaxID=856835 RepID=A0A9P8AMH3_9AGAR|nr:uncharacterized protein BT62DRAFT_1080255 [Guyanagaster necrorhizus MCA 3950]KAG7441258.1 hypothetical protein BT62DRAFT_1080255 [Guyanagaster necrorhizus MCA 3950]